MKSKFYFSIILLLYGCSSTSFVDRDASFADIKQLPLANNSALLAKAIDQNSVRQASLEAKLFTFRLARFAHQAYPGNEGFTLSLQKICFLLADAYSGDKSLTYAQLGAHIIPSQGCAKKNNESSYYYSLNLGMILKEKGMFALDKLPLMHNALQCAVNDPGLDHGGPLRALGMLYLKAPSWPQGIGDIDKALELLKKAASLYPSYPENNIFFAEALLENDQQQEAASVLKKARDLLDKKKWGLFYTKRWEKHIQALEKKLH